MIIIFILEATSTVRPPARVASEISLGMEMWSSVNKKSECTWEVHELITRSCQSKGMGRTCL